MRMDRRAGIVPLDRLYIWEKYEYLYGYTYYEKSSTSTRATSQFYVGSTYSYDYTTGIFTVVQNMQIPLTYQGAALALGKYVIYVNSTSGTYTGTTIYYITDASRDDYFTLTLTPIVSEDTPKYFTTTYLGDVESNNLIKYPFNGIQDDYWYIFKYTAPFTYSGNSVNRGVYYMDSKYYEVYELTSSGTFTPTKPISNMGIWICGGGCGGTSSGYSGGAGAYVNSTTVNVRNPITITIGAGGTSDGSGGTTSVTFSESQTISTLSAESGVAQDGGTGGGDGGRDTSNTAGTGDGIDKHPFNNILFNSYCDGGGGGCYKSSGGTSWLGGMGGTNGGNGTISGYSSRGGGLYGGNGASGSDDGGDGIGYGSGGGGGSRWYNSSDSSYDNYSGGSGYQGSCFIRIPLSQGSYEYSLPEGYVKLDYVQSTAAQAVDTGVFMTNDPSMCIECEFSLDSVMESGYAAYMFGAGRGSSDAGEFTFKDSAGSFVCGNGNFSSSFTLDTTSIYDVYMSTKLASFVSIKNTSTTYNAAGGSPLSSSTSRPSLAIFCRHYRQNTNTDPVYDYKSRIKLYYFRIYDDSGLIRNFIPVKDSSDVAGLYDTVNGVFYTSVTGTDLIAGNVIS